MVWKLHLTNFPFELKWRSKNRALDSKLEKILNNQNDLQFTKDMSHPLQNIGNSYRLVISSVVEKDFGDYSCRASNPLEEDVSQKIVVTGI